MRVSDPTYTHTAVLSALFAGPMFHDPSVASVSYRKLANGNYATFHQGIRVKTLIKGSDEWLRVERLSRT